METETVRKTLCFIFGICGFCFNFLLASVILPVRCPHIGKYKWLLLLYTLSAMFNGAAQLLTTPHVFIRSSGYILYDSMRLLPPYVGDGVLLLYASCFCQNLVILTHCFIFRYYTVCKPKELDRFIKYWPIIMIISLGFLAIGMGAAYYYSGTRTTEYEQLINLEFTNTTGFPIEEAGYLVVLVFTNTGLNYKLAVVVSIFMVFSVISGAVLTILAVKTAKTLRNMATTSVTLARQQKRIFTLLLYQLFMPILFCVIPQNIVVLSAYFHVDSHHIVHLLCCSFTIAQVIDPLMTFYLMKPYRIAVIKKIHLLTSNDMRMFFGTAVEPFS